MSAAVKSWIGQRLGTSPYRVVRGLSAGGMALVYLAEDLHDGRRVVVKSPKPDAPDPFLAARFGDEIRALASLRHPHIVPLLDSGEHEGVPFLVLPYLQGGSLLERWRARPAGSDPQNLATWLSAITQALDFLHRQGWLHRDVKPANILFDVGGTAFLADFGLTKTYADPGRPGLTRIGAPAPGTPRYMAPEMLTAEPADGRADQFSLAVMLYEGLTGQSPFPGDNPQQVLRSQALVQPAAAHRLRQGLPEAISSVLNRGMALRREHRYPSCGQFGQEVLSALSVYPSPSPAGQPTWSIHDNQDIQALVPMVLPVAANTPAPQTSPHAVATNPGSQPVFAAVATPAPQAWHPGPGPHYSPVSPAPGPGVVGRFVRAGLWLCLGLFVGGLMFPGSPIHRSVADPFAHWMEEQVGWTLPWARHNKEVEGRTLAGAIPKTSGDSKSSDPRAIDPTLPAELASLRKELALEKEQKKELEGRALAKEAEADKSLEAARIAEEKALTLTKERDEAQERTRLAEKGAGPVLADRDAARADARREKSRADLLVGEVDRARNDARREKTRADNLAGDLGSARRETETARREAEKARGDADDARNRLAGVEVARNDLADKTDKARKVHEDLKPWFSIVNPTTGKLTFEIRAQFWDGNWSDWKEFSLDQETNNNYFTPGAVKMEVRYDWIGDDAMVTYCDPILINTQSFHKDANPGFNEIDARFQFEWYDGNRLRLFRVGR